MTSLTTPAGPGPSTRTHTRDVAFRVVCAAAIGACVPGGQASSATLPLTDGPSVCAAAPLQREMWQDISAGDVCRVVAFGRGPGAVPPVSYQLQGYLAPGQALPAAITDGPLQIGGVGYDGAGTALLSSSPDGRTLTLLQGWSGTEAVVGRPRMVRTRQGPILVVPLAASVSSNPQDDVVLRVMHGKWVQVNVDDWASGVQSPKGTQQWHGSAMDWPSLRAFGAFSRPHDAECCASGGSYIAQLRLAGTELRLVSVRYSRGDLPFP